VSSSDAPLVGDLPRPAVLLFDGIRSCADDEDSATEFVLDAAVATACGDLQVERYEELSKEEFM